MPSEELRKMKCVTHHASGDADTLIGIKALEYATTAKTVLVGDDTNLLILFCYHVDLESHDLFFCPEPKTATKKPSQNLEHKGNEATARNTSRLVQEYPPFAC